MLIIGNGASELGPTFVSTSVSDPSEGYEVNTISLFSACSRQLAFYSFTTNLGYSQGLTAFPPLVRQALGHHRRDAVAHRDTVQSVRDLHRSLLVRDHDQLRGLLKLLEDRQQARQVHVV